MDPRTKIRCTPQSFRGRQEVRIIRGEKLFQTPSITVFRLCGAQRFTARSVLIYVPDGRRRQNTARRRIVYLIRIVNRVLGNRKKVEDEKKKKKYVNKLRAYLILAQSPRPHYGTTAVYTEWLVVVVLVVVTRVVVQ